LHLLWSLKEAMGLLISLALRSVIPIVSVVKQLRGISSDRAVGLGPNKVLSLPDAVGISLHDWHQAKQGVQQELIRGTMTGEYPAYEPTPVSTPVVVPVSVQGQGGAQG
jgi:ribonucleoside-diphosphate reductase alpha chain